MTRFFFLFNTRSDFLTRIWWLVGNSKSQRLSLSSTSYRVLEARNYLLISLLLRWVSSDKYDNEILVWNYRPSISQYTPNWLFSFGVNDKFQDGMALVILVVSSVPTKFILTIGKSFVCSNGQKEKKKKSKKEKKEFDVELTNSI